ncbi:MAG: hypothetical protein FWF81_14625 [Defluviitaleaceae bacterium]|nr:hypothetical protein [Defluviitaleaceae bacterium]
MSLRRLIAAGLVVSMLAVTGCSSNIPERNQGNRNGQRVADAVNRRPDSYTGRTTRGTHRGINRMTRGIGNTAREITDGVTNRYSRTPNRSSNLGRPAGRMGSTFRRGHTRNHAANLQTNNANRYEMNRVDRSNNTTHNVNRQTRRANYRNTHRNTTNNTVNNRGIALANTNNEAVAVSSFGNENFVFFNKTKTDNPAPEQNTAPEQQAPSTAPSAYDDSYYNDYNGDYGNYGNYNDYNNDDYATPYYTYPSNSERLMK